MTETNRVDAPPIADEREMLTAWLEYQRATLASKCAGLCDSQLCERSAFPSPLSMLGLIRHLAEQERGWFRRTLSGEDAPPIYYSPDSPNGDFEDLDSESADEAIETWHRECDVARAAADRMISLDEVSVGPGEAYSLRWILVHMITEYARHNGHADIVRERIDGATGD